MNNLLSNFPKNKKLVLLIGLLVFGLLLSVSFSSFGSEEKESSEESLEEYKIRMEEELAKLCSSLDGVGKCTVTLSFSKGSENTYKGTLLIETKPPEVLGVVVACRGAASSSVRSSLTELFTSLFAIPTNRIAILKLN